MAISLPKAFAKALRELRRDRRLTQMEVAECARLHLNAIQSLESGRRSPSLETVFRVARALGTTPAKLVALTEQHDPTLREPEPRRHESLPQPNARGRT